MEVESYDNDGHEATVVSLHGEHGRTMFVLSVLLD
jgi:hypothetical protein